MYAADEGNVGEDGEAEPYNKRDKDEVPSKALTGDSRPSDMEDAWGHDPRWQVSPPPTPPRAPNHSCTCFGNSMYMQQNYLSRHSSIY